jgi:C4-dicarboxylate-binding protein DctP
MKESVAYGNEIAASKELEDRQLIIDSKRTEIIMLTPEERNQWVEVMKPVWKQFQDEIGPDLIEAAYQSNK